MSESANGSGTERPELSALAKSFNASRTVTMVIPAMQESRIAELAHVSPIQFTRSDMVPATRMINTKKDSLCMAGRP